MDRELASYRYRIVGRADCGRRFENRSSISTDSITSVDAAAPCGKKRDRKGVIFLVPNPYLR